MDKTGRKTFRSQLAKYLKNKINNLDEQVIKKVKMQPDRGNYLIQLADYVASTINQYCVRGGIGDCATYRRILAENERYVQIWPK